MEDHQRGSHGEPDRGDRELPGAATTRVNKSIEDVFDYLADGAHDPLWQSWVAASVLVRHGGGVGATYRQSLHDTDLGGGELQYRIVRHHRPVLLELEAVSLEGYPRAAYRLEPPGPGEVEITLLAETSGADMQNLRPAGAVRWF